MYLGKKLSSAKRVENISYCHLCLAPGSLTKEHIPPRSAFNNQPRLWDDLVTVHTEVRTRSHRCQAGFWTRSLCEHCNNAVCSPYAQEYVRLVRGVADSAPILSARGNSMLYALKFRPLLVAKQISAMILAVENIYFARHREDLRLFVMDKHQKLVPSFNVWAFAVPRDEHAGTISPWHARVASFERGYEFAGGEISGFPLGVVYGDQLGPGYSPEKLTNITHWFSDASRPNQYQYLELHVRLTGVDSIQSGLFGLPRRHPQKDIRFFH